jgi:hypothetical protein|tara:strand:- start:2206 stop:2385 length:180 start_codon:yes stop_codon:yes gene_type:complete
MSIEFDEDEQKIITTALGDRLLSLRKFVENAREPYYEDYDEIEETTNLLEKINKAKGGE